MSRLAVPQVSQRDTEEIIEAVVVRVVAVIVTALTVQAQVPFSYESSLVALLFDNLGKRNLLAGETSRCCIK